MSIIYSIPSVEICFYNAYGLQWPFDRTFNAREYFTLSNFLQERKERERAERERENREREIEIERAEREIEREVKS